MKTTGFPITLLCAARSLAGPISWINELSPLRDELVDLPVHLPKDRFENEDIRYSSVAPTSSEDYQYSSFGGSFEHLPEAWFESRYSSVVPTSPEDYQYSSFGGSFEQPLDHYLQTSSEESNAEPEVLQQKSHLPGSSRLRDTKLFFFQCTVGAAAVLVSVLASVLALFLFDNTTCADRSNVAVDSPDLPAAYAIL
jgi:hypothetical protein